ncbi:MAG: hypothetical protein KBF88_00040 [Polyangiaceae bacterium]|nr:hypothetical protein [Polyangiaceae bacterium]
MFGRVGFVAHVFRLVGLSLLVIESLACMPNDPSKSAFNAQRMEVRRSLDKIDLSGCSTKDGPTGIGRVTLRIGGNGKVINVVQEWAPFVQDPVGECVSKKLATVTAKPYEGAGQKLVYIFTVPEFGAKREANPIVDSPANPGSGTQQARVDAGHHESKECEAAKLLCSGGTAPTALEACTAAKNACLASMGL